MLKKKSVHLNYVRKNYVMNQEISQTIMHRRIDFGTKFLD